MQADSVAVTIIRAVATARGCFVATLVMSAPYPGVAVNMIFVVNDTAVRVRRTLVNNACVF